ncbi:MAG: hypothetical protein LPK03_11625 [Pontibacter sp.]|nr:hypothetical protein [Pontibacter sp.]
MVWLSGCQTSSAPSGSTTDRVNRNPSPERVDIRGNIIARHYDAGQVMLEVENFTPSPASRYDRAFVLVQPTTQIFDAQGQTISLSELQQGQNVAILLRGGGNGNRVGIGIARKLWLEALY